MSIDWSIKYPNGCTLSLDSNKKILLLNSIEAIREYSKNDSIANRPNIFLFGVISHDFHGSFFRMHDSNLNEVRKTSLQGIQRLILSNPDAETLVFDELERFFAFIDKDVLSGGDSGLIQNAQIFIQQVVTNIVLQVGLNIRFDYELDMNAAVKIQIGYMSKLLSALNTIELSKVTAKNANSKEYSKTVEYLANIVSSLYEFITGAVVGYKQSHSVVDDDIKTFADLLLQKQQGQLQNNDLYSDDDIIVQVFTVFLATCGTTGFTLAWALYYLRKSPKVMTTILEEIRSICGDSNFISWKKRSQMVYTEATINEILRLSSTQALIPRATCNDLKINGYFIPANTPVLLNTFGIHHNGNNWPNPNEFLPERWLNDDGKTLKTHKECFMPFGALPRYCVGDTLSKSLLFSIITNLLNRFTISHSQINENKSKNLGPLGVMRCPYEFDLKLNRVNF